MTITALLSAHGVHVPRYVAVDGQIVLDDVTSTPSGIAHRDLGVVTPIPNHTFHGGEDPNDAGSGRGPWWSDDGQLRRHIVAMERSFPNFTYIPPETDMAPCWVGEINTGRGRFTIGVILRWDQGLPYVKVLSKQRLGRNIAGKFVPSPHLYRSGNLCVADSTDWLPNQHTAATVTGWAAHWLACFTEWRMTIKWPVAGVHVAA